MNTQQSAQANTTTVSVPEVDQHEAVIVRQGRQAVVIAGHFVDDINNPCSLNKVRQDLRTWFMSYVPRNESAYAPGTLEDSIMHYEMLDEFLSQLIDQGVKSMRHGEE